MSARTPEQATAPYSIEPRTHVGAVELRVADLDRSITYYQNVIGFEVIERGEDRVSLGVAGETLLVLQAVQGAKPVPDRATGLYHFAVLVPSQADLGYALRRMIRNDVPVGQGDHLVSEALYLNDPDGNGIEVYRDRPRDTWRWTNGQVQMATDPVDLHGLLQAAEQAGGDDTRLAPGTIMGHVHLKVADIAQARRFFVDTLGFDVVAQMPSALFVSAGGYHHHFGMNIWHSRGGAPASTDAAGLTNYTIIVPTTAVRDELLARLEAAGTPHTFEGNDAIFDDPWRNRVILAVANEQA